MGERYMENSIAQATGGRKRGRVRGYRRTVSIARSCARALEGNRIASAIDFIGGFPDQRHGTNQRGQERYRGMRWILGEASSRGSGEPRMRAHRGRDETRDGC